MITLGNVSLFFTLIALGRKVKIINDYSEREIVAKEPAYIGDSFAFFSLINIPGIAKGITIENSKYIEA